MANAVTLIFWLDNLDARNWGDAGNFHLVTAEGEGVGGFWNFQKWAGFPLVGGTLIGGLFLKWGGLNPSLNYELYPPSPDLAAPQNPHLHFTTFENSIFVQKWTLVKLLG